MKHRALVVEDNPDIAESIADTLESMGHAHEWARSQEEARQKIFAGGFTYVLLDLQIPVRAGRGLACVEYGEHLAREFHHSPAMRGVPILVMTAYGQEGLELAASLCGHGVVDFINKPFPRTGRTLASVIQSVLDRTFGRRDLSQSKLLKPFEGGELVLHPDLAELCGVTVATIGKSAQIWSILCVLAQRLDNGRYKACDGETLAKVVGTDGGQGSIAGSIRDFRRNVRERLADELALEVGQNDVIETCKSGYRLSQHIVLTDRRTGGPEGMSAAAREQVSDKDSNVERRGQILSLIRSGEPLRVPSLARKLGCSYSTAKREVESLKRDGQIAFVGPAKTGYFRIL